MFKFYHLLTYVIMMSGGMQGIDTNEIEKILAKSRRKQTIIGICIGLAIAATFFIMQNVFY